MIVPYYSVERAQILTEFVKDWWHKPLVWGLWDCTHMANDLSIRLGAGDKMKDWKPYKSKSEARARLKEMGFKSLTEAMTATLEKIDNPMDIKDGDIVEIKSYAKDLNALGVWIGLDAVLIFGGNLDNLKDIKVCRIDMQYFTGNAWRFV